MKSSPIDRSLPEFSVQDASGKGFTCRVVAGSEVTRALKVRHRVYVEEFEFQLGELARDPLDDRAYHLLALNEKKEAVASLRLIDAPNRPFEMERFLDISKVLVDCKHPAEITRLAIDPGYRRLSAGPFVHAAIFGCLIRLTAALGISDIVASTRMDMLPLYKYMLFDEAYELTYAHPEIGNAKHIFMRLNLHQSRLQYRKRRPVLYEIMTAALDEEP